MSSFGGKIGQLGENYCGSNNFRSAADENYSPYLHLLKKREGRKFRRRQFQPSTSAKLAKGAFGSTEIYEYSQISDCLSAVSEETCPIHR